MPQLWRREFYVWQLAYTGGTPNLVRIVWVTAKIWWCFVNIYRHRVITIIGMARPNIQVPLHRNIVKNATVWSNRVRGNFAGVSRRLRWIVIFPGTLFRKNKVDFLILGTPCRRVWTFTSLSSVLRLLSICRVRTKIETLRASLTLGPIG